MNTVRTCLGCRVRAERQALLRIVCTSGEVVVDTSATLPGRGAWVHPTIECIDASIKRRAFSRAFRSSATIQPAGLHAIKQQMGPQARLLDEQAD